MAINKVEGIFSDIVVIKHSGNWYGIPFSQIVQIDCAQKKYGLNSTNSKLLQEEMDIDVMRAVDSDTAITDMGNELRLRISQLTNFMAGFRKLLEQYPSQWTDVLTSSLLP